MPYTNFFACNTILPFSFALGLKEKRYSTFSQNLLHDDQGLLIRELHLQQIFCYESPS